MTAHPEPIPVPEHPTDDYFESWTTAEDFARYWDSTADHSAFVDWVLRTGTRAAANPEATKLVSVRLPVRLLTELNLTVGVGGRSAAIREALEVYLERGRAGA